MINPYSPSNSSEISSTIILHICPVETYADFLLCQIKHIVCVPDSSVLCTLLIPCSYNILVGKLDDVQLKIIVLNIYLPLPVPLKIGDNVLRILTRPDNI